MVQAESKVEGDFKLRMVLLEGGGAWRGELQSRIRVWLSTEGIAMGNAIYTVGLLVRHPSKPEWGKGRAMAVHGSKITVAFCDDEADCRKLPTTSQPLEILPEEPDPILDNLPAFEAGGFRLKNKKVLVGDAIARFQSFFPAAFRSTASISARASSGVVSAVSGTTNGRRTQRYVKLLGGGRGEAPLASGKIPEATQLGGSVVSQNLNLLSPFESMALHDGLAADPAAAQKLLSAAFSFIAAGASE